MIDARKFSISLISGGFAAVLLAAPLAARAADATPPYAVPGYASNQETIKGTIQDFDGKYHLHLRDVRGFVDDVTLHDGTVINPRGLQLESGLAVAVDGRTEGRTFVADVVNTVDYGEAPPVYPAWGTAVAPYPYYYGYGYGPNWWGAGWPYYGVSLGFAFGFGGGYWGGCCWGHGPYWGGWAGHPGWGGWGHPFAGRPFGGSFPARTGLPAHAPSAPVRGAAGAFRGGAFRGR